MPLVGIFFLPCCEQGEKDGRVIIVGGGVSKGLEVGGFGELG